MHQILKRFFICSFFLLTLVSTVATSADFTGTWSIDLRSAEEKKNNVECGYASFELTQLPDKSIVGMHQFATTGCGRINENSSITGKANGSEAILIITSERNNAVVKGKAIIKNDRLYWHILKELSPGDPPDDALILHDSVLTIERKN